MKRSIAEMPEHNTRSITKTIENDRKANVKFDKNNNPLCLS